MKYSIIIPVGNDPLLPVCLESVARLQGGLDYEVIVVENGSSDWIQALVNTHGFRYVQEPITGSYQARNAGIAQATGAVLVFTDSDCEVAPNWLQRIDQTLSDDRIDGVMGFSAGAPSTRVAALEQLMYEANIARFTGQPALERVDTRNLAIRRSVIQRIGSFQTALQYGGDMEFGARAHAAGFHITYDSEQVVIHHNMKRLNPLLVKRVRQNYGNMAIVQLHDRDFVLRYFPHLLRYQATTSQWLHYGIYKFVVGIASHVSDGIISILPAALGYRYFKTVNVLAMRLGQLSFVLGKSVW